MFSHQLRVYADDTDFGGVVYHANYLKFMERTRSEWLESISISLSQWAKEGYLFIIRSAEIQYLKPARLNDYLEISCRIRELSRTQAIFQQEIYSADDKSCIYTTGVIKLVCVDHQLKPVRIPETLLQKMMEIKDV